MKHFMARFAMLLLLTGLLFSPAMAQNKSVGQAKTDTAKVDTTSNDDALAAQLDEAVADSSALLGDGVTSKGDIEGAKKLCRDTRGPVASICYQGLERVHESIDNIERSVVSYGSVQAANLEKGCSWITLFIAMAPSLGFLGTVIGMVMAFDQIQTAGDISPTIVAAGMKVALLTTIFGIIVALILQVFYNYILSKIEHITSQMEESAITLLDVVMKYKLKKEC